MESYGEEELYEGIFAKLVEKGVPIERTRFFLDPWNTPYWIRHKCNDEEEIAFVYSFGPNRRRDSSRWKIRGDDVGAYIPLY